MVYCTRPVHQHVPLSVVIDNHHLLRLMVLIHRPPIPTPPRIILRPILIPHLPPTFPASILPALRKPLIQIRPYDPLIQLRPANILHAVQRILLRVILDEAEPTRRLLETVEAHDEPLDLAAFAEELVDLLFCRVEGEVADVEGGRVFELVFGRGGASADVVVAAAVASALLVED